MILPLSRTMKTLTFALSALCLAAALPAAELGPVVAEAAKYQSGGPVEPLRALEQALRDSAGDAAARAEVEAALIRLLAPTSTQEARRFACTQLAVIGSDKALPALAGMLTGEDTVGMACLALGSYPSPKANQALREALAKAAGPARVQIVVTLGDRRDGDAVKSLTPLTRSPDDALAQAAIGALGKISSPAALAELAGLRDKGDPVLARAAAAALLVSADLLIQAGDSGAATGIYDALLRESQPTHVRRAALSGLLSIEKDAGQERIEKVLRGKDGALKPAAIAAIRALQAKEASARFAGTIGALTPDEQVLLIDALASRKDEAAVAAISTNLAAQAPAVRGAAALALGRLGDATMVPTLVKALSAAPETEDRQAIASALVGLKGGEAVDQAIVQALNKQDDKTKPPLISVLGKRASRSSVPALLELAGSADAAVAKAACVALNKLVQSEDLKSVLDRLLTLKAADARAALEGTAAQALSRTAEPSRRTEAVAAVLANATNLEARVSLLGLLPSCGNAQALDTLKAARTDAEPRVREAAMRGLAEWPDASATEALIEAARAATQDTERTLALRGASRLLGATADAAPAATAARFKTVMELSRNADEKKLVLGHLGRVHDLAALQLAESCFGDQAVAAEAALAVATIAPHLCGAHRQAVQAALARVADLPADAELKQSARDMLEAVKGFSDFITAWQVTGPFTKEGWPGKDLFGVVFAPEQGDDASLRWQPMPAGTDKTKPWLLDLGKLYGGDNRLAYARAWVYSETAQPARLELGSDDGIQAWLNGKVVISNNRGGAVAPAAEKAEVSLEAGWNKVLLKVVQWTSGWGYCARLAKPDGKPLDGLRVQNTPPN